MLPSGKSLFGLLSFGLYRDLSFVGVTIGHRSLMRFFRQRLKPESQVQVVAKRSKLPSMLNQYRALGWTGTSGEFMKTCGSDLFLSFGVLQEKQLQEKRETSLQ